MKFLVSYSTKEREWITEHSYRYVSKEIEVEPTSIIRTPCGHNGAAKNRFYYEIEFLDPGDARFVLNGKVSAHINRKKNPKFNPKKYEFSGRVCIL